MCTVQCAVGIFSVKRSVCSVQNAVCSVHSAMGIVSVQCVVYKECVQRVLSVCSV